jgi:DNA replication protein DnaC
MGLGTQLREHLRQLDPSLTPEKITTSDIELTEDELKEAIEKAKEEKVKRIQLEEWYSRINASPVYKQYTPAELWIALTKTKSSNGKNFTVDDDNKPALMQLCLYFAKDQRFVGDLNKGILLKGANGTGKSHVMSFFCQNQNLSFRFVKTRDIENNTLAENDDSRGSNLFKYSNLIEVPVNENTFGHQHVGCCFDDLGSESVPVKVWGTEKNLMSEILCTRYDNKLPSNATHITTNLAPSELEKLYGTRVRDRLKEMCNEITLTGKSRRK